MRLVIVGSRGIPANYGGFETFAEEISVFLAGSGYDVTVQCDPGSYTKPVFNGVSLFYSRHSKTAHPIRYYFEGLRWAIKNSDIILVTGSGGSVFYLLNLFRRKIIITNTDGLEYKRAKWSFPVKLYWRFSEAIAALLSDFLIADSEAIKDHLIRRYRFAERKIKVIEYGAPVNLERNDLLLEKYSLSHKKFYLIVCRLEPENNLQMMLEAFEKSTSKLPLVIAGNILNNKYVGDIIKKYNSDRIRFLGGIYDKKELKAIRFSCRAYFHGHSVGGTNPSLLEAMGSGNIVLCHDNIYNREVTCDSQFYFSNVNDCLEKINEIDQLSQRDLDSYESQSLQRIKDYYNWPNIFNKYLAMLSSMQQSN